MRGRSLGRRTGGPRRGASLGRLSAFGRYGLGERSQGIGDLPAGLQNDLAEALFLAGDEHSELDQFERGEEETDQIHAVRAGREHLEEGHLRRVVQAVDQVLDVGRDRALAADQVARLAIEARLLQHLAEGVDEIEQVDLLERDAGVRHRRPRQVDQLASTGAPIEVARGLLELPVLQQLLQKFGLGVELALEIDFLGRTKPVWENKLIFFPPAEHGSDRGVSNDTGRVYRNNGWHSWYLGSGLNFIYWQRNFAGQVIGFELNRPSLLSAMVDALPHADASGAVLPGGLIRLIDSKGATLHQWGTHEPGKDERPIVSLPLSEPLCAWELRYFGSSAEFDQALGGGIVFNFVSGLAVLILALVVLAVYFYRESSREMREATQRVSFVNQVSHELKTPLTNIRMYAELLDERLDDEDGKTRQHLGVIVSESQRLSRLIGNVLTFARQQRNKVVLRLARRSVDEVVGSVIGNFRPSLEAKGVEITFAAGAGEPVGVDADVLEQILGNLFGNVEKYAALGGLMAVTSTREGDKTIICVADRGPGIPHRLRAAIFDPFCRASDKLTEGTSGTGIGLAIARDLARLHGGDVTLDPTEEGASFIIALHTPSEQDGGPT